MDTFFPKLDLTYLTRIKAILAKELNTSVIDFNSMFFYELYEYISYVEEEHEKEKVRMLQRQLGQ